MTLIRSTRRDNRRFRPNCDTLEARTVLSTLPPVASPASAAYTSQLYLDALGRTASSFEINEYGSWFDRSTAQGNRFLDIVFSSPEYRGRVVDLAYQESFGRLPTSTERSAALTAFGRTGSSRDALVAIYGTATYFANAGGTNAGFVAALYRDILGRGVESFGESYWLNQLSRGSTRSQVARGILSSGESNHVTVAALYGEYLRRDVEPFGLNFWTTKLAGGSSPEEVARQIVVSPEYVGDARTATQNIVGLAASNPNFSTLVAALNATGLTATLNGPGPFTVFAPTNAAFAKLPPGVVDALLADPLVLSQVLLYHVVPGVVTGPEAASAGLLTTVQTDSIGIGGGNGQPLTVNGANVLGSARTTNGVVHVIDTVLNMPTLSIADLAASNPNFSTLVAALNATGLTATLNGPGPFTVFAPTNAAFAKLPPGTLNTLLANPDQLSKILLYHVAPAELSTGQLVRWGKTRTVQGANVMSRRDGGTVFINDARVNPSNLVATNGVIQVIDTVLIPPSS